MPGQRLSMVREVLRLKHVGGHSGHQIAAMVGVSRYTVAEYLRRAGVVGITWPVPPELDDAALERRLFMPPFTPAEALRPQPVWARVHAELRRPGVTLLLAWEEYRAGQPEGYGYSRFCDLYAEWRGRLLPTMRQAHPAGRSDDEARISFTTRITVSTKDRLEEATHVLRAKHQDLINDVIVAHLEKLGF